MSLRLIYGRAGSGKTTSCLKEIKERISGEVSCPLVLLVPEQFTLQAEKDLIRTLGTGGILDVEVLSFSRLAFRVFSQEGGITYPHIHPAGKSMMIYSIFQKRMKEFKIYGKSLDRPGFVKTLVSLVSEFKRYGVSPRLLEERCAVLNEDSMLRDKLREINTIYADYELMLSERYRDSDDDLTLVSERLADSTLFANAEIWIDGFTGFTPQEYKVITKLLTKARRINITLCTDSLEQDGEDEIFSSVKKVYHRLIRIAREIETEIEQPVFCKEMFRFAASSELAHLERNLYAYPYKSYPAKTGDIKLFASINPFSEIEEVARDIVRLCRDEGLRYRDIAVVTRNLSGYERLIEVLFTEYDIPYFMDRKVDITNHPLVRLILSMLDIFRENWSYEAVFRYLKTGLTGIDRNSIDKLENYVLACGIRGNIWIRDGDWTMSTDLLAGGKAPEETDASLEEINRIRHEVTEPLLEFRCKTKGKHKTSEICVALYDYLCKLKVPERIEHYIEQFRKDGELSLAGEYSQVWNILMEVLDQAVEVMGDESLGIEGFADILEVGLKEYKIGLIPPSLDQVLVGSVERSRSHEIKALYLLGVNDGVFPSADLGEGILSDQDRNILQKAGVELASDTRTQAFDEQFLVYRTLTTASGYLHLSWPIGDFEGRSLRPSIIISRLKKIFPHITETSNILTCEETELKNLAGGSPAFRQMVTAVSSKANGGGVPPLWAEVYSWFKKQKDWQKRVEAFHRALLDKNIAEPVSRDKIASLYGTHLYAGISRLERYRSCPFAFYVQYGLGARERKIYRLNTPDIGTFMHKVIEEFSFYIQEQDISWREIDKEWCRDKVSEIVDGMLAGMKGSGLAASQRYTALTVRLKRVVTRALWLIAEHIRASRFEPLGYELGFGEGEDFPPIRIESDSGTVINLIGRIDRVDALETEEGTYIRIVDYKSGGKDLNLSDVYHGLELQLITYLDALRESGERVTKLTRPILPGGVFYFRIDDPIIRKPGKVSAEEIETAIMNQLKMRGLVLADVKIIREMDRALQGPSLILPVTINKGDVLGKNSRAASLDQFTLLQSHVRGLLKELAEQIMQGDVSIRPYKKKGITSCTYCDYSAVCRFDSTLKENSFQPVWDRKDKDVWKLIEGNGIMDNVREMNGGEENGGD